MSTKIYDAYIFDKKYSIKQLDKLFLNIRKEISNLATESKTKFMIRKFVYFYDFLQIRGKDVVNENLSFFKENEEKSTRKHLKKIYTELLKENYHYIFLALDSYFDSLVKENKNNSFGDVNFDFRCHLQVFQIRGKLMAMYFGRDEFLDIILSHNFLSDYHYQNQTDKPNNISTEEWNQRYKDWDKAIGPDYIPINHGVTLNLFNDTFGFDFIRKTNLKEDFIPNKKDRALAIVDTMSDYPNPPNSDCTPSEWMKYLRSEEYINWKKGKIEEVEDKLIDFKLDDLINLIYN